MDYNDIAWGLKYVLWFNDIVLNSIAPAWDNIALLLNEV